MRKGDIESTSLQNEQVLFTFILMFFTHSLQANVVFIFYIGKIYIIVCLVHAKDILKTVFRQLSSLYFNFNYFFPMWRWLWVKTNTIDEVLIIVFTFDFLISIFDLLI